MSAIVIRNEYQALVMCKLLCSLSGIPLTNEILGLLMSIDVNPGLAALADYKIGRAAI